MQEYQKVDAPLLWPSMCICGTQTGPLVDTFIDKPNYGGRLDPGRIYLCRMCVTRSARALGLVKGEQMTQLQNAADQLAHAAKEIAERQSAIEQLTRSAGEHEAKVNTQRAYIEQLQAELSQKNHFANQMAALAKETVAV